MLEGKTASALLVAAQLIGGGGSDVKSEKRLRQIQLALLRKCDGFEHLVERAERCLLVQYPASAPLF
jgi:hypothetical protein